jgi:hypothetical protein
MIYGAKTCYLGTMSHGADPEANYFSKGLNVKIFHKRTKMQKVRGGAGSHRAESNRGARMRKKAV